MGKRNKCLFPSTETRAHNAGPAERVAEIYRYWNRVAVYVNPCEPTGKNRKRSTQLAYLTAQEARATARALLHIARSIERVNFGDSTGTSFTILEEVQKS